MSRPPKWLAKLQRSAFEPVDIASLVFFRVVFGLLMVWDAYQHFVLNRIYTWWIEPRFLFKYYGFSWVHPWPGNVLYIHWVALGFFAFFVAVGFAYRFSAPLFFLSYSYFFLLDQTRYQNHTYLICLLGFLLIFLPANRAWSVDAWLWPRLRSDTTPAWTVWLLRTQMAIVYFFGGIAKIEPDWLRGEPMRTVLARQTDFPIIGRFFRGEWAVYTMSYGGFFFDLFLAPFLLWRRTRVAAFCVAVVFHLINAQLFSIDVFPWLAIALTALFFPPDWPRRALSSFHRGRTFVSTLQAKASSERKQLIILSALIAYVALQILLPLRPFLSPDGSEWLFMQHRFCWRMMLQSQSVQGYFYVTDPNIDATNRVNPLEILTRSQGVRLNWRPDTVVQVAHHLATAMPRAGPKPLIVQARLFVSVNHRRPELFVDPIVNLAAEPRPVLRPRWLLPTHEPLPPPGKDFSRDLFGPISAGD